MTRNKTAIVAGAAVLALAAGGVGIAQAVGGDDDGADKPISGARSLPASMPSHLSSRV